MTSRWFERLLAELAARAVDGHPAEIKGQASKDSRSTTVRTPDCC